MHEPTSKAVGRLRHVSLLSCYGAAGAFAQEVSAAKPGMVAAVNRNLDAQVASYGIHPGRTGLSNVELLAALKMLRCVACKETNCMAAFVPVPSS
jgi:hypothetical protein